MLVVSRPHMSVRKKDPQRQTLPPVDVAQRYAINEATSYLRISHASIYKEIKAHRIRIIKRRAPREFGLSICNRGILPTPSKIRPLLLLGYRRDQRLDRQTHRRHPIRSRRTINK